MAVNSFREDEQIQDISKIKTIKRLFKYLLKYKKEVSFVIVAMLIAVVINLINPLLVEQAIDKYIKNKDLKGIYFIGVVALSINIIFICMIKLRMYIMSKVVNKILLEIRGKLYEHIQKLSFSFFDSRPTGKILARIIGDVNALKMILTHAVTNLIPDLVTIIGVVIIMIVKDWRLALASMACIPFMIITIAIMDRFSHARWKAFRDKSSNVNAYVHECVSGMNIIQGFGAEDEIKESFEQLVKEQNDTFISAVKVSNFMYCSTIDICWAIGVVLLYFIGVKIMGLEYVSEGILIAFGTYISMFWGPVTSLSNFYNQLITNLTAAQRVFEIMDIKPDIRDKDISKELPKIQGNVEFKNVSFAYDAGKENETKVLDAVSFKVKQGESIALVGPTGAGKSTIVNLISRFYDVTKGEVLVDGHNIQDVSIKSLRSQMGIMTQDSFIFKGTIRDNIAYGKLDATEKEIIEAAKAVDVHDFIMQLDKGYDTEIKEGGAQLSIGQRQLIAFARTMVCKPKILILDEATSSIDTHTEQIVQRGISAMLKGRTSFIIAHRLSTIQNADRIFVIDKGGIIEEGSPSSLMNKKGHYYKLYMSQFKNIRKVG